MSLTVVVDVQSPSVIHQCRASRLMRVAVALTIILPPAAFAVAVGLLWGTAFNWAHLAIFLTMYVLTGFGVTVGFHRFFTHQSFRTSAPVRFILGVCGSMAIEGPVLKWVAGHRMHHQHSDHEDDPHSPHLHGAGFRGLMRGIWHSHMGWLFAAEPPDLYRYVGDLQRDPVTTFVNRWFLLWAGLGLILPAIVAGLITWSWMGLLFGFLWAGLARVFLIHHVTWSINSICHLWGSQPYRSNDESRNNVVCGVLAMGEGWHNNHHAFPNSARHGLKWWQLDVTYLVIRLMALLKLATGVKVPDAATIARRSRA